jgi:hypothetical protein
MKKSKGEWNSSYSSNIPNHIKTAHYDQMQMQMAVMEREWCDYVVYSLAEDIVYEETVPFNPSYWKKMLKDMNKYVDKFLSAPECIPFSPSEDDLTKE